MQKIPFLIFLLLLSNPLIAQEEDIYENIAQEICECISKHDTKLTPALKDVLISASLDMEHSDEILTEYFEQNLEQGLKDTKELETFADGMERCMTDLEEKYSEIYVNNVNNEIEQRLQTILDNNANCKFAAAILRIGLSTNEDEDYSDEEYGDEETE